MPGSTLGKTMGMHACVMCMFVGGGEVGSFRAIILFEHNLYNVVIGICSVFMHRCLECQHQETFALESIYGEVSIISNVYQVTTAKYYRFQGYVRKASIPYKKIGLGP